MKRFVNEKEVTSTLIMEALFSGCTQIDGPVAAIKVGRLCQSLVDHAIC